MTTLDLLRDNKPAILAIAARHGARNVRVFGSAARGEDRPDSDIDFVVEMADDRSLYDLIGLQQEVERLLGRRADVLSEDGIHPRLKKRILSEARPL
jgi:hypothetical protein